MAYTNSVDDIFRFIQLRPRRTLRQSRSIALAEGTALVKRLSTVGSVRHRADLADAALNNSPIRSAADLPLGPDIVAAVADLRGQADATTSDLLRAIPELSRTTSARGFRQQINALSDLLLAAHLATDGFPADLEDLQDVFRVYALPEPRQPAEGLADYLTRPLLAPSMVDEALSPSVPRGDQPPRPDVRAALEEAIDELVPLDRDDLLVQPEDDGTARKTQPPFTLTATARKLVSPETSRVLKARGINLAESPIDVVVDALTQEKQTHPVLALQWSRPVAQTERGRSLPPAPKHALVRPAGVADLLVVKQQIKRYEAAEIAHIENVLIGEKKSRAHRQLERSEETFLTENETTRTDETELQSTDRFELNRETSRTIRNDQKTGAQLTVSGKYGPTVDFSTKVSSDSSTSQEETAKNSSRYAQEVMSRSLERITERVREVRTRTIIRETEETNLHELDNQTNDHVRGIYQFLDKIYEAQVFNYGIRQMFDFMVPEPASFLWWIAENPTLDIELPQAPQKLESLCPDASHVTEDNAFALAAEFGADIEGPPAPYVVVTTGKEHGENDDSETGQPRSVQRLEVTVPKGYRPLRAHIRGVAITDENPVIAVVIGSKRALWKPTDAQKTSLSAGNKIAHRPTLKLSLAGEPYALSEEAKLGVSVLAYETKTYSVEVLIVAARTREEKDRWRLATYQKIRGAYEDRVREYEQKVEQLRSEAEAKAERENRLPFGAPPPANQRTVATELKKHCLTLITQQRYDAFDATRDGDPPLFDFIEAAAEGAYVRFFEQAFEWDQMQWVFYPYFWARKSTWVDRFVKQDVDPIFLEFLRAGSARVVVPVRPGFEVAVTHFVETGKIWGGDGDPPQINSPLYVSIIDEIRERTGAPQGEIAVGDPWEARVPTALALVRATSDLPTWSRTSPQAWDWRPDDGN